MGLPRLVCAFLLAACCCCRRATSEFFVLGRGRWWGRSTRVPQGPGVGSWGMSSTEPERAGRAGLAALQSGLCTPAGAPPCQSPHSQALRVRSTSLQRVCSLGSRVFWERTRAERLQRRAGRGGAEFLQDARAGHPQVLALGAGSWSRVERRGWGASPTPCSPRPPVAGKGSFPCWRGPPTPPPPPGPHASLEVSEGGGSSCRGWALASAAGGVGLLCLRVCLDHRRQKTG